MRIPRWSMLAAVATVAALGCDDRASEKAIATGAAASSPAAMNDPDELEADKKAKSTEEQAASPTAEAQAQVKADQGGGGMGLPSDLGKMGHGAGSGSGKGLGNGASPNRAYRSPDNALTKSEQKQPSLSPVVPAGSAATGVLAKQDPAQPPRNPDDVAIDPNGRFVTTYRPGGGHLAAFESAVTAGLLPQAEREIVSDVGARYLAEMPAPKDTALAFQSDFERTKAPPGGGSIHVRLSLRSTDAEAKERPHLSVVLVLDVSGSMRGQLIESARTAATALVDRLDANDDFSLILFSTEAKVVVPIGHIGPHRDDVKKTISEIHEGGGTNIGEGLRLGYEQANDKKVPSDAVRVVMLLSDGRANDGITNRQQLSKLSLDAFQTGIQTSSFGLGTDYDGPLMSQIANDGAGGYYYLRDGSQIAPALGTELDKRLDPVATALEIRVRLKPGVELLNVYGSRRLTENESQRVRTIEVAEDQHEEAHHGIKANRQNDVEGGMRFFIPAFARNDQHSILLKLRVPEGVGTKDVALVELKYKDRIAKKNVADEFPVKLEYADSDAASARSLDPNVSRSVQGFLAGETLMKASQLVAQGQSAKAVDLLGEREGILHYAGAQLGEPLFVEDAKRLARLRVHAAGKDSVKDPLVLAMMMETAGNVHLH